MDALPMQQSENSENRSCILMYYQSSGCGFDRNVGEVFSKKSLHSNTMDSKLQWLVTSLRMPEYVAFISSKSRVDTFGDTAWL